MSSINSINSNWLYATRCRKSEIFLTMDCVRSNRIIKNQGITPSGSKDMKISRLSLLQNFNSFNFNKLFPRDKISNLNKSK